MSSILGAAVAPFIAVALWQAGGGSPFWVGIYLSAMAVLTLIALIVSKETKDVDMDAQRPDSIGIDLGTPVAVDDPHGSGSYIGGYTGGSMTNSVLWSASAKLTATCTNNARFAVLAPNSCVRERERMPRRRERFRAPT